MDHVNSVPPQFQINMNMEQLQLEANLTSPTEILNTSFLLVKMTNWTTQETNAAVHAAWLLNRKEHKTNDEGDVLRLLLKTANDGPDMTGGKVILSRD